MSGGKHTLGQWKISLTDRTVVIAVGRNGTWREVATIEGDYDNPREWPIMEANARLIAAAPETAAERDRLKEVNAELLAALKLFRTKVYNAALGSGMDHEWATEACSLADAAISKAEGGAE